MITMYPWEGKEYHRGAYSMEATGAEKGMFSEAQYNPVGSYIKYFDLDRSMCGKSPDPLKMPPCSSYVPALPEHFPFP